MALLLQTNWMLDNVYFQNISKIASKGMLQGLSETEKAGRETQAKSLLSEDMCQSNF